MSQYPPSPAGENFERAFSTRSAGCVRDCACGRVFYNPNGGWTWEDGEVEALAANPKATALEWACGEVEFEGATYAADCDCWHQRAVKVATWIISHAAEIAEFLSLERERKTNEAEMSPVVRAGADPR